MEPPKIGRPRQREGVKQNLTIRISPLLRQFLDSSEGVSIAEYEETYLRKSSEFKAWMSRRAK